MIAGQILENAKDKIIIDNLLREFCNKFPYGDTYDLARFMYVKGMEDSKNNN